MALEGDFAGVSDLLMTKNTNANETKKNSKSGGFQTMGLSAEVLKGVMRMGFNVPTPVQRKCIPPLLRGNDVVAMARTGSGKTAAYLIPILTQLREHSKIVGIRALVLAPTRELALQIARHAQRLGKYTTVATFAIVGGSSLDSQFAALAGNPDIVVACPGRLLHIVEDSQLHLPLVKTLVLDEADRLFELGLQPQILAILKSVPEDAQRALFSATMPTILAEFANAGLRSPVVVRLDAEMRLSDKLKHTTFIVRSDQKTGALIYVLKHIAKVGPDTGAQALVFVESKHRVEHLEALLNNLGTPCFAVHGQMDQEARRLAIHAFTKKQVHVLIVTDVAARGLDLPLLDNVINYSYPCQPKLYLHRVGRVARAGRAGCAYSIMTVDDLPYFLDVARFLEITPSDTAASCDAADVSNGFYGRIPEDRVQMECDIVKRREEDVVDVCNLAKIAERGWSKYIRTRKHATRESQAEAHDPRFRFEKIHIHPMLLREESEEQITADAAKLQLRKFKSKDSILDLIHGETVFRMPQKHSLQTIARSARAEGAAEAPEGKKPLSLADSLFARSQERKRAREEEDEKGDELPAPPIPPHPSGATSYRDPEFYVEPPPATTMRDASLSIKDATMDITGETAAETNALRSVYAWNKRKNRYQKMNVNDANALLKGVKNEAGAKVNFKGKLGAYSKWVQRSGMRIPDAGEEEDSAAVSLARQASKAKKGQSAPGAEGEAATAASGLDADDPDYVDISDPNQGRKLKVGRKQKRLPKEGHVRTFDEITLSKRKKEREQNRLSRRAETKTAKKKSRQS